MEQLIPPSSPQVTEQEYLRSEESAATRHEFRHGRILDMAGGTSEHASIASNLIRELGNQLKAKSCRVFGSDLRVGSDQLGHYGYPDVTVVCGPVEYHQPEKRTIVTNPRVIIEVTCESTEADDRGEKFNDYRAIDSLKEYFLVAQDRLQVESFYRQDSGIWAFGPRYTLLNQSVRFVSLGVEVSMAEIYDGIQLRPEPVRPPVEP